jgi:NNP family nitrate/nitrite transporter-like MFS transporter
VFAWVARRAPAARVGAVTGVVGAAGGLGGFFPPLVMGATYDEAHNNYTVGLGLLCLTAAIAFIFVAVSLKREPSAPRVSSPVRR